MISVQRLKLIQEMIEKNSFVSVKEIMERFEVSRSSAMRDLIELENQGIVIRERGGAMLKEKAATVSSANEAAIRTKENLHASQKREICKMASQTIQEGDCIYIDGGTTPLFLAEKIANMKVTIITPNTYFLEKLSVTFPGTIYLLGGEFGLGRDMSYGPLTIEMLKQFNFDLAFLSTNGIDLERKEVSVFDFQVGAVKKEVLKRCKHNRLLVDSSKIGKRAICSWAQLDSFQDIYMDTCPLEERPENVIVYEEKGKKENV
ncbi:DeoR/GlpR family DNA-binding transcription regulator [Dubosiella newyorkensis]|jgi:DeoR family fructose operon transcriptional repressor|uniref:Lactose phosphotransferase system repressor n=1 Tax=Dubosiella newyorkensis TaxID=1862672 RepID=A0A1U7NJP6_9FIRM|nr:DeoR/GlpR family DNA-binding transcription regulator [Dubosiella newyorkensis]MCI9041568.1 DeoR/GlpR transcriptional regulator [Dubosiella newyorkensis]OLU43870.1 DeoR family transcriptional regulator [Dubosiella newyorkensis]